MQPLSGEVQAFAPTNPQNIDAPPKIKAEKLPPVGAPVPQVEPQRAPASAPPTAAPIAEEAAPSWLDQPHEPEPETPDWLKQPKEEEPSPVPSGSFKPVVDTNLKAHAEMNGPKGPTTDADMEEPLIEGFMQQFKAGIGMGWQTSTTGLKVRGKMPDKILPEHAPLAMMIGSQISQFAGDLPTMAPGLVVTGGSLGLGAIPGLALAGALPAAIRKHLMDEYSKGAAKTPEEVVSRLAADAYEGVKGGAANAAMAVGGPVAKMAGPLVGQMGATVLSKTAELAAMTTVSAAISRQMPSRNDILSAAIVMGGTHLVLSGASPETKPSPIEEKIQNIHAANGDLPHDLVEKVKSDPILLQDMIAGNAQEPAEAAPTKLKHEIVKEPAATEGGPEKTLGTKTTLEPITAEEMFPPTEDNSPHPELDADALHVLSHIGEHGAEPTALGTAKDSLVQGDFKGAAEAIIKSVRKSASEFYTNNGNNLNPANKALEWAAEKGVQSLPENDPKSLLAFQKNWKSGASFFAEHGTVDGSAPGTTGEINGPSLNSILGKIKNIGGSREEFTALTLSKSVLEKYDRAAEKYTPYELPEGFDVDAARRVVKNLSPKYEHILGQLGEFNDRVVEFATAKHLLSEDQALRIKNSRDVYSPTHRAFEFDEFDNTQFQPGSAPFKKVQAGGNEKFLDPITQTYLNMQKVMKAAITNEARVAVINKVGEAGGIAAPGEDIGGKLLREVEEPMKKVTITGKELANILAKQGLETVKTPDAIIAGLQREGYRVPMDVTSGLYKAAEKSKIPFDPKDIFTLVQRDPVFEEGKLAYRVKGELRFLEGDKMLIDSLRSLDGDANSMGMMLKVARGFANFARFGITGNPVVGTAFAMGHNIKSQTMAVLSSRTSNFLPLHYAESIHEMMGQSSDLYKSFLKSGGAIRVMDALNERYIEKSNIFTEANGQESMTKPWNLVTKSAKAAWHFPEAFIQTADNLARFTEYRLSKKQGLSDVEAGMRARNVLPDYQMIGLQRSMLRTAAAFSSAHINSQINLAQNLATNWQQMAPRIGMMGALSAGLWYLNKDDEAIKSQPDWVRDTCWTVNVSRFNKDYVPGKSEQEATILKIPKPFSAGILFASGVEHLMDQFVSENPNSMKHISEQFGHSILPEMVPTMAQPMLDQFRNRNGFSGQPLVPYYKEQSLPEQQMKPYTSESAKIIGGMIGKVPYMKDLGPAQDPLASPAVVENYFKGWGQGYLLKLSDSALKGGKAILAGAGPAQALEEAWGTDPWENSVMWSRFTAHFPSFNDKRIADFYDIKKEADTHYNTIHALEKSDDPEDQARAEELKVKYPDFQLRLNDDAKALSEMRGAYRNIQQNKEFSRTEKYQLQNKILFDYLAQAKSSLLKIDDFNKEMRDTKMAEGEK